MSERPEDGLQPDPSGGLPSDPTPERDASAAVPPPAEASSEEAQQPRVEAPAQDSAAAAPPADGGYGQAPPPTSAYPDPGQGGFAPMPPPATGQYGQPGPGYGGPPPGSAYGSSGGPGDGAPYGGVVGPQATDSIGRGWALFKANPWPFVLAQLAWAGIFLVPTLVMVLILAAAGAFTTTYDPDSGSYRASAGLFGALGFFGIALMVLIYIALAIVQMGAFASATLKAVDGGQVTFGDFFKVRNFTQLLILALLIGIASAVLSITFIGPLIVIFFGVWAIFFVVDRNQGAIDAIRSSFNFAGKNAGQSIVLILLAYVLNFVGALLCGIGTLITNPVTLLGYADFYRRITGPSSTGGYQQAPQYG